MADIFKFLTYVISHHGYWETIIFITISMVPLLAVVYIVFLKSALGQVIDKKFSEKIEKEQEVHKQGNKLRKQFNKNVIEILQDLAEEAGADRALVFEYSNGSSNLVGLPFLFMSAAAEVVTPNTNPVGHNYQKINISIGVEFLTKLEEHGYIYIDDLAVQKNEYPMLAYFMLPNNAKSALFYSLQGIDDMMGFLVITTTITSGKTIDKITGIPMVARAAQKISALLNFSELSDMSDEINKKNKFKWLW